MFRFINSLVENTIGANRLDDKQRAELKAEQIHQIGHFTPAITLCAIALVTVLMALNYHTSYFWMVTVWGFCIATINAYGLKGWIEHKKREKPKHISNRTVVKSCQIAALLGVCWAALPIIAISSGRLDLWLVNIVAVVGVVFGSSFALATLPQAVFAFIVPIFISLGISIPHFINNPTFPSLILFLSLFAISIPVFALRQARNLVNSVSNQIKIREQKDIIGLLLHEYEENASDWLWEIDLKGRLQNPSARFCQVSGLTSEQAHRLPLVQFLKQHTSDPVSINECEKSMDLQRPFRILELPLTIDEQVKWWRLTGKPNYDHTGRHVGYIGIGSDITSEKISKTEINKLALSDPLTGLMNRTKFNKQMDSVVSKLERYGTAFSVMFLDLDNFKIINDTRGHLVGDKLLKKVAKRISETVRETDSVARLGGDEFAIIMRDNCAAGAAARLASKLLEKVSRPYMIDGERHKVGISIGIALAPQNGTQPTQLLRNADLALYRSKADGRGVFRFFESQMDSDQREKRMLEGELREAIDENQFELYFQPLVSPHDGRPTGMEALIRWNHPIRGTVSPAEFIPIAEQSSLIQEIGNWTLQEACRIASHWPEEVGIAVNLSAQHFIGTDIVDHTKKALQISGLDAARLELEITESLLINNAEEVLKVLRALKKLGVSIALDDFGTGYSSLSYILKYPFDKIKIDRSFVETSHEDDAAKAILHMIGTLGQSLNIKITAEGVETAEQAEFLKSINCDQYQGYYFSKPLQRDEIPAFFLNRLPTTPRDVPADRLEAANTRVA